MKTNDKRKQLYQNFSHYQKLSEQEKEVFWDNRKKFIDDLELNEKAEWDTAIWNNISDIKERLLQLKPRIEKLNLEIV